MSDFSMQIDGKAVSARDGMTRAGSVCKTYGLAGRAPAIIRRGSYARYDSG